MTSGSADVKPEPAHRPRAMDEVASQPSLCAAFQATVAAMGDAPALRSAGEPRAISWREYGERVRALTGGLSALGVQPDDAVALLLRNVPEFHLLDVALLHLRAIPFSMYVEEPVERVVDVVQRSGARLVVLDATVADRLAGPLLTAGVEQLVITGDGPVSDGAVTLGDLERLAGADFDFDRSWREAGPRTRCTIVYTSGTTGAPKGVELSHRNILFAAANLDRLAPVAPGGRTLSYLPNSHLAERFMSHYMGVCYGYEITCVPDPGALHDTIREARPTRFFGVPRIYEKLLADARAAIDGDAALTAAFGAALAAVEREQARGPSGPQVAEELGVVRERLGFGEVEWMGVAAAPSSRDMIAAFLALGLPLGDIWGLTECLMTTMNPPGHIKLGTVGRPFPGIEVALDDAGEILVRGENVFLGYRNDPERTHEVLGTDGWLRTGDLGRIDADGYLAIVGRAKEMIINAAGLNISPVTVEQTIASQTRLIEHIAVIGDRRRYLTALIVLDPDAVAAFAHAAGLTGSHTELVRSPPIQQEVARAVAAGNERLAPPERVRRWHVLSDRWTPDVELTSLMKLKRSVITQRYAAEIDAMYA